jgi:hypothetical protein
VGYILKISNKNGAVMSQKLQHTSTQMKEKMSRRYPDELEHKHDKSKRTPYRRHEKTHYSDDYKKQHLLDGLNDEEYDLLFNQKENLRGLRGRFKKSHKKV